MDWNRWGRILLFANVGLSVMFVFGAFAVYRDRMDFPAESKSRQDEIERYKKVLAGTGDGRGAEARWQLADHELKAGEARRPELAKWYGEQLASLRAGPAQPQAPAFGPDGKLQINPANGRPVMAPPQNAAGQPIPGLASLEKLREMYTQAQNTLRQALVDSDMALATVKKLTAEIGHGQQEGSLRFQLAQRQQELKRSEDQHEYLQPLLYNRQVEVQILTKRHKALESRLEELKSVAVAKQPLN
jgi:hypothetical protein